MTMPLTMPRAVSDSSSATLIAEGTLQYLSNGNQNAYFLVTWQGHPATLLLGFGIDGALILTPDAVATLPNPGELDSLVFGSVVDRHLPVNLGSGFRDLPGLPPVVGMLGNTVLTRYDIVIDGPARRVRLYARTQAPSADAPRTPPPAHAPVPALAGAGAACTPIVPMPEDNGGFVVQIDHHPITAILETRSTYTKMNVVAGTAVGLTQHSPHIRPVPGDIWEKQDAYGHPIKWQAHDLPMTLGTQPFTATPILIFPGLDVDRYATPVPPVILLNLNNVRQRRLVISNSTQQVCLNQA